MMLVKSAIYQTAIALRLLIYHNLPLCKISLSWKIATATNGGGFLAGYQLICPEQFGDAPGLGDAPLKWLGVPFSTALLSPFTSFWSLVQA
jgi:hypothetical protein